MFKEYIPEAGNSYYNSTFSGKEIEKFVCPGQCNLL